MTDTDPFFVPDERVEKMRMDNVPDSVIQHEVFYESSICGISDRPLYIGGFFQKKRFFLMLILSAFAFAILFGRAFWMQIIDSKSYQALAENNRLRHTPIWPERGIIRDREGRVLADNVSRFQATVLPRDLPTQNEDREAVLGEAGRLLGLSIHDLDDIISATSTPSDEETIVAPHVAYDDAMAFAVALPHLPGFALQVGAERRYPMSSSVESLSHVLGYVGKLTQEEYDAQKKNGYRRNNQIGKTGLERSHETDLRGIPGERVAEVDAKGNVKSIVGNTPAQDGKDLHLSLDLDLQQTAEIALRDEMKSANVTRGAVVALDPRDGSVLAAVSLPAFDDNQFSGGVSSTVYQTLLTNPDQPLFPRAWAGTYPSGSTVKIVISAAALAEKVITADTTVNSTGGIKVGPWFFPDWKAGGHGITNVRKAIAWSINTFYYTIGGGYESFVGLGVDRLTDWMRRFGLGTKTGVDLPSEGSGFVPSKDWKQKTKGTAWFVGDTYNLSIGQGDLLVTPLQVANYTASIANGGIKLTPHLVLSEGNDPPIQYASNTIPGLSPSDVKTVQLGMRDAVTYGSARGLSTLPFSSAGKTGTAQWSSTKKTHAWFTSFAPFEKPEIVVTALLEEGGEGSSVSVPVAKKVLQKWWDLKNARNGKF
ncbi:MAG TPA: penicillin-binding protein 2 [Patescibacteria group bacterium]|nr:penicillin-binding protein 2 [Patescibacteria group bacterium]